MTNISVAEHRAIRAEFDLDYTPVTDTIALFACREFLAHLEGNDHVEPTHEETECDDCSNHVAVAWAYGQTIVCRTCRRRRLLALRKTLQPVRPAPEHTFVWVIVDQAERWVRCVATTETLETIHRELVKLGVPTNQVYELVDLAADIRASAATTTIQPDAHAEQPVGAP